MKLKKNSTLDKFDKLDDDQMMFSSNLTPDVSSVDIEPSLSIRFSSEYLKSVLRANFDKYNQIPIEKFEIDLFELSKKFNTELYGKNIDIGCVAKIHHILKAANKEVNLLDIPERKITQAVRNLLKASPFMLGQYQTLVSMMKILDGLLVKWKIAIFKNYDYRYSGRALNVRMLDLSDINSSFINVNILWISTQLFEPPLNSISNSKLLELARILHDQVKKTIRIFLYLNPKQIDEQYNIEKSVAFQSEKFWRWSGDQCPEENITNFKHVELKMLSFFAKCFGNNDPRVEVAYKALLDLETVYRSFEKTLIGSILNITGRAEF